jgi:ribosomal protein L32
MSDKRYKLVECADGPLSENAIQFMEQCVLSLGNNSHFEQLRAERLRASARPDEDAVECPNCGAMELRATVFADEFDCDGEDVPVVRMPGSHCSACGTRVTSAVQMKIIEKMLATARASFRKTRSEWRAAIDAARAEGGEL